MYNFYIIRPNIYACLSVNMEMSYLPPLIYDDDMLFDW